MPSLFYLPNLHSLSVNGLGDENASVSLAVLKVWAFERAFCNKSSLVPRCGLFTSIPNAIAYTEIEYNKKYPN